MTRTSWRSILLSIPVFMLSAGVTLAQISYDPWADAVQNSSGTGVDSANNAVGAPDGQYTNLFGVQKSITLDMGEGEEGTETLRVYFGNVALQSDLTLQFLDKNLAVIKTESRSLGIQTGPNTLTFGYRFSDFSKAYRYVRLIATADLGFSLDAVEAFGYIGSTPTVDTDGDGIPDRTEQQNGTDPQVPNTTPPPPPPQPPASCTSDTWSCGDWSSCSADGRETRTCVMTQDCPGVSTPSPTLSRSCVPPPPPASCDRDVWTCSEWSTCSVDGRETRSCSITYDCPGVSTPSPALARSCTPPSSTTPSGIPSPAPAPSTPSGQPPSGGSGSGTGTATSADTTAPTISNVTADALDPTTVKISWTTDEPSDSQVEYGTPDGVQRFTPLDQTLTTNHVVWLSDLRPGTDYVYRALSRDEAGNLAMSPEDAFTTPADGSPLQLVALQSDTCWKIIAFLLILLALALILAGYWYGKYHHLLTRDGSRRK